MCVIINMHDGRRITNWQVKVLSDLKGSIELYFEDSRQDQRYESSEIKNIKIIGL